MGLLMRDFYFSGQNHCWIYYASSCGS